MLNKQDDPVIQALTQLIGSRLKLAAAAAGAIALAGCANMPADGADAASAASTSSAPAATPAKPAPASAAAAASAKTPVKTVTLPQAGRVSLSEYRAQMRDQLMKSENATEPVADCAAHASWVVPRSSKYDALKIPTGALTPDQASVERWEGRFSQGKQAVPVSSVVSFSATAHNRRGDADWQPIKIRCGYDDGMMLAYELLDSSGNIVTEAAAAPAVRSTSGHASTKSRKGGKASASRSSTTKSSSSKSSSSKATASKSSSGTSTKTSSKSSSTKKKQ